MRNGTGGGGIDFTSALYLGLRHPSRELGPWQALTAGVPAGLRPPEGAEEAAADLAALQGCEAATLLPSTLHLFWDLFGVLAPGLSGIWVDRGAYPVARWGVERARGRGVPVRFFAHHDPGALRRSLARGGGGRGRPLVVADGFCPTCGRPAPLAEYLAAVRARGGTLVVDDTQALGIFGKSPGPGAPYGREGGGSLRRCGIGGEGVLVGCSLAKGFGAPLAALSGPAGPVGRFEAGSATRQHSSPPSVAAVRAALRALEANRERGEALRAVLAARVGRLRRGLAEAGLAATGGLFPVQTLRPVPGVDAATLHARLGAMGIRSVLHGEGAGSGPLLTLIVTATHSNHEIDRAVEALALAARPVAARSRRCNRDPMARCPAGA